MHPTIVKFGPMQITAYGLMLAISFVVGVLVATRRAKKYNINPNNIIDLAMIIIISAIFGARFFYVIFHLNEFKGHWLDVINPFQSSGEVGIAGLTLLGGLLLSILTSFIYLHVKKLSFLKFADAIIPAVGLGIFFTRIGCFLTGCCYGVPTELPWGVVFPSGCAAHFHYGDAHIHPSQLYSSFYGLVIFFGLLLLEKKKMFDGFLLYWFLILYGISRFLVDFTRYYETSMRVMGVGISVNQVISLCMIVAGVILLFVGAKNRTKLAKKE